MAVMFRLEKDGTYDLWIDGRIADPELEPDQFEDALRRRRVHHRDDVFVEDMTGYRTKIQRRRR